MELYQFEAFIAVAEEHSFTKAAERVFRTQAAVSVAIKKLEDEVGVQLLTRDSHGCLPTDAGVVLLGYARRIVELRNETQSALGEFTRLGAGHLSIAAHESASQYFLPDPIATFHRRFPEIKIETRLCSQAEVARLVADQVTALGVGVRQADLHGLRSELLHIDPLVLVVAPNHRLTHQASVMIADLNDEEFFVHHMRTPTADMVQRTFDEHGTRFKVVAEMWNFETVKQFVKAGAGIALIPLSVCRQDAAQGTVVVVPVQNLDVARRIEVVYREKIELLPPAREFLHILRHWPSGAAAAVLPPRLSRCLEPAVLNSRPRPRPLR
jgi:DNA-binding transcriptional LysR family regulator